MAATPDQMGALLSMLESNLELILDYLDSDAKTEKENQLKVYINTAISFITTEGIELGLNDDADRMLVVMYAEWLYDKRKDPVAEMPRMLRYSLNNRLFSQKMREDFI